MLNRQASVISTQHQNDDDDEEGEVDEGEEGEEDASVCARRARSRKKKLFQGQPKYGPPVGLIINNLRQLTAVHPIEVNELIIEKLEQCCVNYDFLRLSQSTIDGLDKTSTLAELADWFKENDPPCDSFMYSTAMTMGQINLVRYFPATEAIDCHYCVDVQTYEAAWPHLSHVYEILLLMLDSRNFNEKIVTNCISFKFASEIINLFDSPDSRERAQVKKLVHRLYVKLHDFRRFIRFKLYYVLLEFIHETDKFNGVAEILEIFASIIPGLSTPLQTEHLILFYRILLPLHKAHCLHGFHGQLMYTVAQFVEKDQSLFEPTFNALVRHWPRRCAPKQVMFLSEIDELVNIIQPEVFDEAFEAVLKLIEITLVSEHYQVVERTLQLLNNERVNDYITQNYLIVYVFPQLYNLMTGHWCKSVKTLTYDVLLRYKTVDEEYFDDLTYYVKSGGRLRPKPIEKIPLEEEGEFRGEFWGEYADEDNRFTKVDADNEENEL